MYKLINKLLASMSGVQARFPTAWEPAREPGDYPLDLDGSYRYTRPKTGIDRFPFVGGDGTVSQIGMVSGFMNQRDVAVWQGMTGKIPSGPFSTTQPINLQWQATIPGLVKQT